LLHVVCHRINLCTNRKSSAQHHNYIRSYKSFHLLRLVKLEHEISIDSKTYRYLSVHFIRELCSFNRNFAL
jgi:hypothetical protein